MKHTYSLESARMEFLDFSKTPEKPPVVFKDYQIWIGDYDLGQGYGRQTDKPTLVATVNAIAFDIACLKYELRQSLEGIERQEKEGYVDNQTRNFHYNWRDNRNSWTGRYFETEKEAWTTFRN